MSDQLREWQQSYELGIEDIDFQHHFFFNLIMRLAKELRESADPQYRAAIIAELNAYARFHFISEENLMMRTGFPEYIGHRYLHLELLDQLAANEQMLSRMRSDKEIEKLITFLIEWFMHHTIRVDRLFADFLHASKGAAVQTAPSSA